MGGYLLLGIRLRAGSYASLASASADKSVSARRSGDASSSGTGPGASGPGCGRPRRRCSRVCSSVAAIISRSTRSTASTRLPGPKLASPPALAAATSPTRAVRRSRREFGREVLRLQHAPGRAHGHGPLNLIAQLPHVARPPVLGQHVERVRAQLHVGFVEPLRRVAQEERAEVRNLLAPIAQRRDVDADDAEAVVQILAESALGHALLEIGVGRGQHAHVHARSAAARRPE